MKLIRPTAIIDAMLASSSVAENDLAEWSGATSYALGATVMKAATHRRYQSLVGGNLNHDPAASGSTQWQDIGPTNRWAMFDASVGTLTTATGSLTVSLQPGSTDALALVDIDAEQVSVTMSRAGTQVYAETQSTNAGGAAIDDWFSYFFEPIGKRTVLTFLDLPIYGDGVITVTQTGANPAGPVNCGTLIVGRQFDIGSTEVGAKVGLTDFSKKVTDDFGVTSVVERPWSKQMQTTCMLPTANVDAVQRALAAVRARPVLWIGEEGFGFDALTIYGFFKDFSLDLTYSNISYCSLTIEGLT